MGAAMVAVVAVVADVVVAAVVAVVAPLVVETVATAVLTRRVASQEAAVVAEPVVMEDAAVDEVAMADTNAGRGAQGASQGPAVPSHWQHKRVLLVDDHRAYRLLIGAFLHTLGLAHEAVGDGVQALQA